MGFFKNLFLSKKEINKIKVANQTLNNIAWSFSSKLYISLEEFNKEITKYQKEICKTDKDWKPNQIIFDFPELQIQYNAWIKDGSDLLENEVLFEDNIHFGEEPDEDDMYQVEIIAKLKAENEKSFTALEFLMKVHNQQANKDLGDHVFFEGINETKENINDLPTCYIVCGS